MCIYQGTMSQYISREYTKNYQSKTNHAKTVYAHFIGYWMRLNHQKIPYTMEYTTHLNISIIAVRFKVDQILMYWNLYSTSSFFYSDTSVFL